MSVAEVAAQRSLCSRAQVGAVVVTADNRAVSTGHNGPPPGFEHDNRLCKEWCPRAQPGADISPSYDKCESLHAEVNGVIRANFTEIRGGTIYVSGAVCINCARVIAASGLSRIVHRVDATMAYRNPERVEAYLQSVGIEIQRYG